MIPKDVLQDLKILKIQIQLAHDLGVKPNDIRDPLLVEASWLIHGGEDPELD